MTVAYQIVVPFFKDEVECIHHVYQTAPGLWSVGVEVSRINGTRYRTEIDLHQAYHHCQKKWLVGEHSHNLIVRFVQVVLRERASKTLCKEVADLAGFAPQMLFPEAYPFSG